MSMARRGLIGLEPGLQQLLLNLNRIHSKEEDMCSPKKMQEQEEQEKYELKQKKVKVQLHKIQARETLQCQRHRAPHYRHQYHQE